jgi:hypothetical protein|nr:MAG TPA: hypothetical protein [Caudoviricetes sp.]
MQKCREREITQILEGWLVDLLLLMEVCRLLHNYKRKFRDKKLEQPEKKRVIRLSDNMMN